MRLSHPDYRSLVVELYKTKRNGNNLSSLLVHSTPANIRRECLIVYKERYDKKDDNMLRTFFGPAESGKQFLQLIEDFETDKFKPLDNYLKGITEKTDDKNLELLAWLIDFRHRPYVYDMQVILTGEELKIIGKKREMSGVGEGAKKRGQPPGEGSPDPPPPVGTTGTNKGKLKTAVALLLVAISFLGVAYIIEQGKVFKGSPMGNANVGCMYWAGEQYKATPCNEDRKGQFKLPMDVEKMRNFKRIMQEDTISERSIGKVHYIKINGGIEYYTTKGNHPVDVTRALHQLSPYMYDKYLKKQEIAKKDL